MTNQLMEDLKKCLKEIREAGRPVSLGRLSHLLKKNLHPGKCAKILAEIPDIKVTKHKGKYYFTAIKQPTSQEESE